jgi:ribonucleoside-diphosphate reductase alpha chain
MDVNQRILSDITVFMKYARYIPELNRRETWTELIDRNKAMHLRKFPQLKDEIEHAYEYVYAKKVLPSMRSLQFAGKPIEVGNQRMYNCCALPVDHYKAFSETLFLLLSGTGVGYSVQYHHVAKLDPIVKPTKNHKFVIEDSIAGWADAVKALMKSYFTGRSKPRFDFSDIRPKGMRLVTSGGKAPGPEPLKICLTHVESILERKENGEKLTPIECHDIMCHLADAVLSGGIRRAAMIALFSFDDNEMLTCKYGNWWELNPQRARANNSAIILRNSINKEEFKQLWKKIELSNSGEPGISWSNDLEYFYNPCHEACVALTFCNLVEINASTIENEQDFYNRCRVATFISTLQASYTDFYYLRTIWKQNTERDALIGVGITGIAAMTIENEWLSNGTNVVLKENERVAKLIGINVAARSTLLKPGGTTSLVLGTSSGIHAWHNDFYIRRIRVNKNESIYPYLKNNHPHLIEDEYFRPHDTAVISIPQKAPVGAVVRTENVFDLLERVKTYNEQWVYTGHRKGPNKNNVSATISIKPDEWEAVGEWMWLNRDSYSGISVLPYDGGTYIQAPFEDITEARYLELSQGLGDIDLSLVIEDTDNTDLSGEVACAGGVCEIV